MHKLLVALFVLSASIAIHAQTVESEIGLTDRLMNNFLLCDRAVIASIAAKYDEVDILKYNKEYDKFATCAKRANRIALKAVQNRLISCSNASKILYLHRLTCQTARDNSSDADVKKCQNEIVKICNDFIKR